MPRTANYADDEEGQRRNAALEMRRAGASLDQITRRLNYASVTACRNDINKIISDTLKMSHDEAKALELIRIDGLLLYLWPEARRGVAGCVDRVIKLMELRAKLLGLFAPVQVEQVTFDAVESEIKRLEQELGTAARKAVNRGAKGRGSAGGQTPPREAQ